LGPRFLLQVVAGPQCSWRLLRVHDLLPGLNRALSGEELRDGVCEMSTAAFWLAFYFAGDMIPKSRLEYVGAVSIALIVAMVGLIVWD